MELMNPSDTLAMFQTTKDQRIAFAGVLVNEILEGRAEPLKVHLQVKCMEDLMDCITKSPAYKKAVLDAAAEYGAKQFELHNAKFQTREAGVKYDYSQCNDALLDEMLTQQESLTARIKERQKMLQAMPGAGLADPENGNLLYPPSKSSTTTVAVTLK